VESGAFRLFLASGLYLQVGVALAGSLLLANWRRPWVWALLGLLVAALIATYTRGFWVGAAVALLIVLGLGSRSLFQPVRVLGGLLLMVAAATAVGYAAGLSLPNYIMDRAASITETTGQAPVVPGSSPSKTPQATAPAVPPPGSDASGDASNAIRLVQARILLAHIAERPILGWGFGTIAPDYPYDNIPSYELAYVDLAYKTGLIGLVLWVSFPARLMVALMLARLRRIQLPDGLPPEVAAAPLAIVASVLVTGSTNPYILASYGLLPIIWAVAWLEPAPSRAMSPGPSPGQPS
jgi:O-antigen ligase